MNQKRLHSLSELEQLLPQSKRKGNPEQLKRLGHNGKGRVVSVTLDTRGRKGKSVTLVSGLHHNPDTMEEIARTLKHHCGAGGTVKEGDIEIQGDQRGRVAEKLREMNYIVR